jgi:hypothetical protein
MMHGPNTFLAAEPRIVGITRLIAADRQAEVVIPVTPQVLFVAGADLHKKEIRPGAEYLGLLRRLETTGLALHSRILLRATTQAIKDTFDAFKPSIVHFICHGGADANGGYLE